MAAVVQFAGRVGPEGRIEAKNCADRSPDRVSIRPASYSTCGLATLWEHGSPAGLLFACRPNHNRAPYAAFNVVIAVLVGERGNDSFACAVDGRDLLDAQIVKALNERAEIAAEIGRWKQKNDVPIYSPQRERKVYEKVLALNGGPMQDGALRAIYREIMSGALALAATRPVDI